LNIYDQNGDGALTKVELQECPGILRGLLTYDANRDGSVDAVELKSYFETLYSSEVGLMSAGCTITRSGKPVIGAIVRFIPEAFLGEAIYAAEGITDRSGYAQIAVPDEKLPASYHGLNMAQVGVYRVEVETSPGEIAESKSLLGIELNPTSRQSTNPAFDLAR